MAESPLESVTDTVRDALYISIGAGVIAFQKLQVRRVELTKAVNAQIDDARGNALGSLESAKDSFEGVSELVDQQTKVLEQRLSGIEDRFETVLARIEDKLPEQARDAVKQARELVGRAA